MQKAKGSAEDMAQTAKGFFQPQSTISVCSNSGKQFVQILVSGIDVSLCPLQTISRSGSFGSILIFLLTRLLFAVLVSSFDVNVHPDWTSSCIPSSKHCPSSTAHGGRIKKERDS